MKTKFTSVVQRTLSMTFLIFLATLAGCASQTKQEQKNITDNEPGPYENLDPDAPTVVTYDNYSDPLEGFNRSIFKFNDVVYRYALSPLSRGYRKITPKPVIKSIGNFFLNLREPLFSVNNLFQGKPAQSGRSLVRLGINSTLGVLGLFDPANVWFSLERAETSFGDTLAYHGVGYGAYLVLPFAGPADFRTGSSTIVDYFVHPLNYLDDKTTATSLKLFDYFQDNAATLESYPDIVRESDDPYLITRNLYLQRLQRDADALRADKGKSN